MINLHESYVAELGSNLRPLDYSLKICIRAVSPEPSLLAHTRGTFRQKARSLAPLNGWACAVKICLDGMLEDTNSLDAAQIRLYQRSDVTPHETSICYIIITIDILNCDSHIKNIITHPPVRKFGQYCHF